MINETINFFNNVIRFNKQRKYFLELISSENGKERILKDVDSLRLNNSFYKQRCENCAKHGFGCLDFVISKIYYGNKNLHYSDALKILLAHMRKRQEENIKNNSTEELPNWIKEILNY